MTNEVKVTDAISELVDSVWAMRKDYTAGAGVQAVTAKKKLSDQLESIAERLTSTLDTAMPSEQADAIVRDVIEEIYHDILGVKGSIVVDADKPVAIVHGGFGKYGRRKAVKIAKYKFQRGE